MKVSLTEASPDPAWRKASCWPDGATTYVIWEATAANGNLAPRVRTTIAAALCNLGLVVFLGGPGGVTSNEWRQIDGGWAGGSPWRLGRLLRKSSLRFMASRDVKVVETLFDQPGFDWSLRGQAAYILENHDTTKPPMDYPDSFAVSLQSDPPQRAPPSCIAILRPGTDGDFAEFHAMTRETVSNFERDLPAF